MSSDSLTSLYDKGTSWDFLILFVFFPFVPKSGKRIPALSIICREEGLAHQDFWRPAPYPQLAKTWDTSGDSLRLHSFVIENVNTT